MRADVASWPVATISLRCGIWRYRGIADIRQRQSRKPRSRSTHHDISLRCGIWPLSGQYRTSRQPNALNIYGFTAFCNGPDEVKSPSDCHAAENRAA